VQALWPCYACVDGRGFLSPVRQARPLCGPLDALSADRRYGRRRAQDTTIMPSQDTWNGACTRSDQYIDLPTSVLVNFVVFAVSLSLSIPFAVYYDVIVSYVDDQQPSDEYTVQSASDDGERMSTLATQTQQVRVPNLLKQSWIDESNLSWID
jgi:hypothetical protein